ncbi:MAG: CoA transferase [Myxococcota bacterium]|jgi:crotonobetainyl-CoA:carnitine CoA-transferase CaiB-like acyl-CoA transferase|nr:CoA transferase [Myxococcota bacterium]
MTSKRGPCSGIRVLDFTTMISGPLCTQVLGDLGADILKLESPLGDAARYSGAPFREPGFSGFLAQFNRNKRSLVVDLKRSEGRQLVLDLLPKIDVVVENFRPGVMEKLGLGYSALSDIHPGLVYAQVNGFGDDGPYAERPAYDQVLQGLTGLMPAQGGDGPPALVQGAVADKSTALTALSGVLAALLARERDPKGRGQRVEIAMIDAFSAFSLTEAMMERSFPPLVNEFSTGADFFRTWKTADGHVVGLLIQDAQFAGLCRILDRPELAKDPRFEAMVKRFENWLQLVPILDAELRKLSSSEFLSRAESEGVPFAPVNDLDAFLADPQVQHRRSVVELNDPRFGPVQYLAPPIRFERTPASIERHAPRLGEHTDEVLEELGVSADAIRELRELEAIR